jgi:hypothetical protein
MGSRDLTNNHTELDVLVPIKGPSHCLKLRGGPCGRPPAVGNVASYTVTRNDSIIPCRKDNNGKYLVDGVVMLPPQELLVPFIRNCLQIFNTLPDMSNLALIPKP